VSQLPEEAFERPEKCSGFNAQVGVVKRITILHTIETAGPGGAETMLLDLASRLDNRRFRSLACLPEGRWLPKQLRDRGVPTFVIEGRAGRTSEPVRSMARLVRQERVDLIHSHLPDQNFYSCLVGRLTGCKTVVTYHGAPRPREIRGLKGKLKVWVIRHWATAVVVVSDYLKQAIASLGISEGRIIRIYNGVDPERFAVPSRGHLRAELGCADGAKLIGTVANLRESKGYEFLIQAARKVVDSIPEARFLAVGEPDSQIAAKATTLLKETGLQDRFLFLGFREDVPEILQNLDLFVLPSVSEGFSLATIEAMAAGRPVVVTRSGGPEEIVTHGTTGLLVPPRDSGALAASICELLCDPDRALALGRCARADVQRRFSLSQIVSEYETLYERCLNSR
jgi:glycosyltransferase involved in cell wall biosynthesis